MGIYTLYSVEDSAAIKRVVVNCHSGGALTVRSQPYTNPLSIGTLDTCVTQLAVSTVLLALKYVLHSLVE